MKRISDTILWRGLEGFMRWLIIIFSSVLILLLFATVILRYCFNTAIFGYEEILALTAVWVYLIGGAYGSYEDSHISADMTDLFIKNENVLRTYKLIMRAITVVICGVFTFWSWRDFLIMNISAGTVSTGLHIPQWIPKSSYTAGFTLMFIFSVNWLVSDFLAWKNHKKPLSEIKKEGGEA